MKKVPHLFVKGGNLDELPNPFRRFSWNKFPSVECAWAAAKDAAGWGSQAAAAKPGGTRVSNCNSEDTDMDCKFDREIFQPAKKAKLADELGGIACS